MKLLGCYTRCEGTITSLSFTSNFKVCVCLSDSCSVFVLCWRLHFYTLTHDLTRETVHLEYFCRFCKLLLYLWLERSLVFIPSVLCIDLWMARETSTGVIYSPSCTSQQRKLSSWEKRYYYKLYFDSLPIQMTISIDRKTLNRKLVPSLKSYPKLR